MNKKENKEKRMELRKLQTRILSVQDESSLRDLNYRKQVNQTMAKELYLKIKQVIQEKKVYRDPTYSAKDMASELNTNTRYLSAVVNSFFGKSYSSLINEYRIKEAVQLLSDKRYKDKTIKEIGEMVGFANRQSFYTAFFKYVGERPLYVRKRLSID